MKTRSRAKKENLPPASTGSKPSKSPSKRAENSATKKPKKTTSTPPPATTKKDVPKKVVHRKKKSPIRRNVLVDSNKDIHDVSGHTIQELRSIAVKEGISVGGQKAQLEQRIKWHRQFNLNSTKVEPVTAVQPVDPTDFADAGEYHACDERLQQSLKWLSTVQIWSYFVKRSGRQGYLKGKLLKKAAFLRNVSYSQITNDTFQVRGYCGATMRKSTMYLMKLEHNSNCITKATCECPAGKGNSAACKHLGALMVALEEFSRNGNLQQNQTCTEVLQTWHRPPKNTDRSMMFTPIKELYKDARMDALLPKVSNLPSDDLTKKMFNSSLNRGLRMAIHRSRHVQSMSNYFREHSYAKPSKNHIERLSSDDDSEEDIMQEN